MPDPLSLVAPGPVAAEVGAGRVGDGTPVVVLRLETISGSWCAPLIAEQAENLANALLAKAAEVRGMVVVAPPTLLVPNGHEHPNGKRPT